MKLPGSFYQHQKTEICNTNKMCLILFELWGKCLRNLVFLVKHTAIISGAVYFKKNIMYTSCLLTAHQSLTWMFSLTSSFTTSWLYKPKGIYLTSRKTIYVSKYKYRLSDERGNERYALFEASGLRFCIMVNITIGWESLNVFRAI